MNERTDTERLDWLIRGDRSTGDYSLTVYAYKAAEQLQHIHADSRGSLVVYREAIYAAINAKEEVSET